MSFDIRPKIESPTLIIDKQKVFENIRNMAEKARAQSVRFRPHFKTHQSAVVGEWFRPFGISEITVSSVAMGEYFIRNGWRDVLIAFTFNLRQVAAVRAMAEAARVGLLLESEEAVDFLSGAVDRNVEVWIKIDSGTGRTGLAWDDPERVAGLARRIAGSPRLRLRGLLTHAGFTYSAASREEVIRRYSLSCARMNQLRMEMRQAGIHGLEISVGDTPGCTLSSELGPVDEIRPGNFVFFDAQMLRLGVCQPGQVAAVLACPVVALHPQRGEAVIYGGAVHLSKDMVEIDGRQTYGAVVDLNERGWSVPISSAYVARLSQEHGILSLPPEVLSKLKIGGLIGVVPAHVCLAVSALQDYLTLEGEYIPTYAKTSRPTEQA